MLDPIPEGYISLDEAVGPLTADILDQELAEEQQDLESNLKAHQDHVKDRSKLELPPLVVTPLTKRELALIHLHIALRDGELPSSVRDPQTGQFFRLTGLDWWGAAFWREMIVGGVVRGAPGEGIDRHKGSRILLKAAEFDAWRQQRAQKRPQPAEVACAAWLEDLLRNNPKRSPKPIPELRAEAMTKYRVSARKFDKMLKGKSDTLGIKWKRGRRPKAPNGN
jgi:hypothetical protein